MSLERVPISSIIWWSNIPLLDAANVFTNYALKHSTYGNTAGNRYTEDKYKTKNQADAWWVEWAIYTDPDWALIGNRMWSLRGYPLKTADWSIWGFESFITCDFPTYDWLTTYTKKTTINSELTVWTEDRTWAWSSYTPIVSGSGGGVVSGDTIVGKYKRYGKTCHCWISGDFSKDTLAGRVYFSLPYSSSASGESAVSWVLGVIGTTAATSYWYPTVNGGNLEFLAGTGVAGSWDSLSASTLYVRASFTYETT